MKLLKTEITPLINDMMHMEIRDQSFFWSPFHSRPSFHAHPELQLTYIVEGYGRRFVGNIVESFASGDMVFIGSNVPHIWLSDPAFYEEGSGLRSKAIIAYFDPKIFLQVFHPLKEFDDIREMIRLSSKGIRILGETNRIIASELAMLTAKDGFEKVTGLLQIMNRIAVSTDKSFIIQNEADYSGDLYPDKLIEVINFIKEHFHQPITLRQIAGIAGMTEQSFCRFFKQRTKKSFSAFLSDLRIEKASEMLIQTDKPIAEIARRTGHGSSPHFCRKFKEYTGVSPLRYKIMVTKNNTHV